MGAVVLELDSVSVTIDSNPILADVDLTVRAGDRWVVLGANGSGKSTLLRVAGLALHPSSGTVRFLGNELGRCDIRPLRARIGTSSAALVDQLRPTLVARDVVKCAAFGALEPWWHTYTDAHHDRADELLSQVGLAGFGSRRFGSLSSGERQRTILARGLMSEPDLLLLDEPMAGLDLGGREELIDALENLDGPSKPGPATILVTHHVEDIPPSFSNFMAIGGAGQPISGVVSGPTESCLTEDLIYRLFGVKVVLSRESGRWHARSAQ